MPLRNGYTTHDQIQKMQQELADSDFEGKSFPKRSFLPGKILHFNMNIMFGIAVVLLSAVLILILLAKSGGKTPVVFGFQLYEIESASMDPTLPVGSIILSQTPEDADSLKVGDIITFINSKDMIITHRIIEVVTMDDGTNGYKTKGDNVINSPDSEVVAPSAVSAVLVLKVPLT